MKPLRKAQYKSLVLASFCRTLREQSRTWLSPEEFAGFMGWELEQTQDELADLNAAGMVNAAEMDSTIRVSLAVNGAVRQVALLLSQVREDWFLPYQIAGSLEMEQDLVDDALAKMDQDGTIEVAEFEDGVRVKTREKPEPLTTAQQDAVVNFMPLVKSLALKFGKVYGGEHTLGDRTLFEEFISQGYVNLIETVKKRKVDQNFPAYARKTLAMGMKETARSWFHYRGTARNEQRPKLISIGEKDQFDNPIDPVDKKSCTVEVTDEIEHLMSCLSPVEMQAVHLVDLRGMTLEEAGIVCGTNINDRRRAAMEKMKVYAFKKKQESRDDILFFSRRSLYPRTFFGTAIPWCKYYARESKVCPGCLGASLQLDEYCLVCDSWGFDETVIRESRIGGGNWGEGVRRSGRVPKIHEAEANVPVTTAWLRTKFRVNSKLETPALAVMWKSEGHPDHLAPSPQMVYRVRKSFLSNMAKNERMPKQTGPAIMPKKDPKILDTYTIKVSRDYRARKGNAA